MSNQGTGILGLLILCLMFTTCLGTCGSCQTADNVADLTTELRALRASRQVPEIDLSKLDFSGLNFPTMAEPLSKEQAQSLLLQVTERSFKGASGTLTWEEWKATGEFQRALNDATDTLTAGRFPQAANPLPPTVPGLPLQPFQPLPPRQPQLPETP